MKRTVLHLVALACFGLIASTARGVASATTLGLNTAPLATVPIRPFAMLSGIPLHRHRFLPPRLTRLTASPIRPRRSLV